jgi:hypothetical protein
MGNRAHRRPHPQPATKKVGLFRRLFGASQVPAAGGHQVAGYASSRVDAELMAGYLRSQGIKAVVSADDEGGLSPVLQAGQRVRILVPGQHHAEAKRLLEDRE